MNIQRSY